VIHIRALGEPGNEAKWKVYWNQVSNSEWFSPRGKRYCTSR